MNQKELTEKFKKYQNFVYELLNKYPIYNLHLLGMDRQDLVQEANVMLVRAILDGERLKNSREKRLEECIAESRFNVLKDRAKSLIKSSRRSTVKKEVLYRFVDSLDHIDKLKSFIKQNLLQIGSESTYIFLYIQSRLINVGKKIMTQKRLPGCHFICSEEEGGRIAPRYHLVDADWERHDEGDDYGSQD